MTRDTRAPRARLAAALLAAGIVLAACGGPAATAVPTLAPVTDSPPTVAPPATVPATPAPPSPGMSLPSVDQELEDLLPDDIAGEPVVTSSVGGEALVAGQGGKDFEDVLKALDKEPSDLTAALGGTTKAILLAFRIKGVDAATFFDAYLDAAADQPDAVIADATIAGKPVKRFSDGAGSTLYVYFVEGAIVTVSLFVADDAILTEIFEELP